MDQHPKLSISIVHHHGLEMLRDCLQSIYANRPAITFETIVVDNASIDGAVEMVTKEFPQVKLIRNTERHGFGHNQNTGISTSSGEYIFILNDDTIVHDNALSTLCMFLDQHPQTGLLGPKLLNSDGTVQQSCYKFPSPLRCIWENTLLTAAFPNSTIFGDYRKWSHDSVRDLDFVIGAAMLVRRQVIDQVGMFDPLFFMYAEETDWQMRIKRAGWNITFCPEAKVTHLGGQSTQGIKDRQFCEFQISSAKLMYKHYGALGSAIQRLAMIEGSILRIALWSILGSISPAKRNKALQQTAHWTRLLKWWVGLGPHQGLSESPTNSRTSL